MQKHIESFPKYSSHYSRNKNINKVYMSMEYSISSLYVDYRDQYAVQHQIRPISKDKYQRIFTEEFNISFTAPNLILVKHAINLKSLCNRHKIMTRTISLPLTKKKKCIRERQKLGKTILSTGLKKAIKMKTFMS